MANEWRKRKGTDTLRIRALFGSSPSRLLIREREDARSDITPRGRDLLDGGCVRPGFD